MYYATDRGRDLKKYYSSGLINKQYSRAVDGVSFHINRGNPGTGGREQLRQDHCGKAASAAGRAHIRPHITFDGTVSSG